MLAASLQSKKQLSAWYFGKRRKSDFSQSFKIFIPPKIIVFGREERTTTRQLIFNGSAKLPYLVVGATHSHLLKIRFWDFIPFSASSKTMGATLHLAVFLLVMF